jgi:hypothetical protein
MSEVAVGAALLGSLLLLSVIDETSPYVGALALVSIGGLVVLIARAASDWLETRRPR